MHIELTAANIGALITDIDVKHLSDDDWRLLYQTWLDRNVIVVRGQSLTIEDFLAYSRRFGQVKPHRVRRTRHPDYPEITRMGADAKASNPAIAPVIHNRGQGWHTDSAWDTDICKATQLYGIEIPSFGGDTLFANMYTAYQALPQSLKARIEDLKAEFSYGGKAREGIELLEPEDRDRPPAVHSVVRVHPETGRKALYVNPSHIVRILGMPEAESDRLLAELFWYMLQPGAEYRHKWAAGDVVIWDNRCSVHSAAGGYSTDQRRIHWRTTIIESTNPDVD